MELFYKLSLFVVCFFSFSLSSCDLCSGWELDKDGKIVLEKFNIENSGNYFADEIDCTPEIKIAVLKSVPIDSALIHDFLVQVRKAGNQKFLIRVVHENGDSLSSYVEYAIPNNGADKFFVSDDYEY